MLEEVLSSIIPRRLKNATTMNTFYAVILVRNISWLNLHLIAFQSSFYRVQWSIYMKIYLMVCVNMISRGFIDIIIMLLRLNYIHLICNCMRNLVRVLVLKAFQTGERYVWKPLLCWHSVEYCTYPIFQWNNDITSLSVKRGILNEWWVIHWICGCVWYTKHKIRQINFYWVFNSLS